MKNRNHRCKSSVRQKMLNRLGLTEIDNAPAGTSVDQAPATPPRERIRLELLRQCGRKPLRDLFVLDALITREPEAGITHSSFGTTDEDGDCLNCERKYELRSTDTSVVRIQVPVGVTREEASRVLRKAAEWIEDRHDVLDPEVWEGLGPNGTMILHRRIDARNG